MVPKVLKGYLATHAFQYTLHGLRSLNYYYTQDKPYTKMWVDYVRFLNIISMGVTLKGIPRFVRGMVLNIDENKLEVALKT